MKYLIVLHTAGSINENDIKVMVLRCKGLRAYSQVNISEGYTIGDGFSSDARSILAIALLIKFNSSFAVCGTIHAKHAQITNVYSKLFYRAAPIITLKYVSSTVDTDSPESVASRNQYPHSILHKPEADLAQVRAFADPINANKYDAVGLLPCMPTDHT